MDYNKAIRTYLSNTGVSNINLRAALIDMDGVLYDSMKNHTAAWFRMATELGIEADRNEFYLYEGMTGLATINILFRRAFNKEVSAEEAKELYKLKAQYFIELGEPEMMTDADKMLTELKTAGIDRVLVTGSGQDSILERLSRDYPNMFDYNKRVTAHDVKYGKPNPEPYLMGMKLADCKPSECIVIENAPLGVKAGHDSGAFTIAITTGPIHQDEMWRSGANLVFNSMTSFANALPELITNFASISV